MSCPSVEKKKNSQINNKKTGEMREALLVREFGKTYSVTKSQITEPQKHNPAQPLHKICHRLCSAIPHFS